MKHPMVVAILVSGCGFSGSANSPKTDGNAGAEAGSGSGSGSGVIDAGALDAFEFLDAPRPCTTVTLTATRTYPTGGTNGTTTLTGHHKLVVPRTLPVSLGDAGTGCAELDFKRKPDNALLRCRYTGDAQGSFSFAMCTQGAACPSQNGTIETAAVSDHIEADQVAVHIDAGDPSKGTTVVTLPLVVCP